MPCEMVELRLELSELKNSIKELKEYLFSQKKPENHESRFLKCPLAAKHLGVSISTLQRWREMGVGPKYKKAGARTVLYKLSDLDEWKNDEARCKTA